MIYRNRSQVSFTRAPYGSSVYGFYNNPALVWASAWFAACCFEVVPRRAIIKTGLSRSEDYTMV